MFYFRDFSNYFYPLRLLTVDLVRAGHLPLWNPYMFAGYPLFATLQLGFLYPLNFIHFIAPFTLAFNYYTAAHYPLAALFMFWLMRYFGLSRPAAVLAALVFAFSGFLLSVADVNTTLSSVIWLPLLLLFYDRHLRAKSFLSGNLAVLGALLAVQFLGGEPSVLYLSTIFLFIYGLFADVRPFRNSFGLALSLLAAGALSAVQLLPFLETALLSVRSTKTAFAFIALRSVPPRELLNFIFPFFFGNIVNDGYFFPVFFRNDFQTWLISPYVGVFPLVMAVLSLARGKDNRVKLLWVGLFLSLGLALGRYTPFYGYLYNVLPGLSFMRYPAKYLFLAVFAVAALAGFGYERLREWIEEGSMSFVSFIQAFFLLSVAVGLICRWVHLHAASIQAYFRGLLPPVFDPYYIDLLKRIIDTDIRSLTQLTLTMFFGLLLFYLVRMGILKFTSFSLVFIALVATDLVIANTPINQPVAAAVFESDTPNIRLIKNDRGLFRTFAPPPRGPALAVRYRSPDEKVFHEKDNLIPDRFLPYQIMDLGGRESIESRGFQELYIPLIRQFPEKHKRLLDMANVKYIFTFREVDHPELRLLRRKVVDGVPGCLYENTRYLPRAYFPKFIKLIEDHSKVLDYLTGGEFDPDKEVVLEDDINYQWQPALVDEGIERVKYLPNEVGLEVYCDRPRILFLSDAYYPGWSAYIDGRETKILRANYMFRAVQVPPGRHEILFIYEPMSVKVGAAVSGAALALLLLLGLVSGGRRLFRRKNKA